MAKFRQIWSPCETLAILLPFIRVLSLSLSFIDVSRSAHFLSFVTKDTRWSRTLSSYSNCFKRPISKLVNSPSTRVKSPSLFAFAECTLDHHDDGDQWVQIGLFLKDLGMQILFQKLPKSLVTFGLFKKGALYVRTVFGAIGTIILKIGQLYIPTSGHTDVDEEGAVVGRQLPSICGLSFFRSDFKD